MRNINQKKAGVILSYISMGINAVVQLVYTPIMIAFLGASEYGTYQLVGSFVSYLNLFNFGISGAYLRFYSRYKANEDEKGINSLNGMYLLTFAFISIIVLIAGVSVELNLPFFFGSKLSSTEQSLAGILFLLLVINLIISLNGTVFNSFITAQEKFFFQRILSVIRSIANPLITLPLLFLGFRSIAVVSVTTLLSFCAFLCEFLFCKNRLDIQFRFKGIKGSLFKEIFGFSFFVFLNMIVNQINWNTDKYVLGRFAGTISVAVYSVGSAINSSYISLSTSISSVFAPGINRMAATGDRLGISNLFIKVGRLQFIMATLVASGFLFYGKYFIINIYAGKGYADSYYVALLLIFAALVPLTQNLGIEVLRAINRHKFRSVVYLLVAISNVIISIPLSMHYGPIGAATGTFCTMIIGNVIFMNVYYQKQSPIDVFAFWKSILKLSRGLILPVIYGALSTVFIRTNSMIIFCAQIIIYSVVFFVSFWFYGFNQYEKSLVLSLKRTRTIIQRK